MTGRILVPGEVGAQLEPRLTVDGLRDLLQDLRRRGQRIPKLILVSEYDRRDLNQDLLAGAQEHHGDDVEHPDHDGKAIGFIEGVMVRSHPDVARGKARFIYPPVVEGDKPLPSGKVISLGAQAPAPKTILVVSG